MTSKFLALGLATTMVGIVSAHILMPAAEKTATLPGPEVQSQRQPTVVPIKVVVLPIRNASLAPEALRPPVPVLLAPRHVVASTGEAAGKTRAPGDDAAPLDKAGELAAKVAIEMDGYKGVRVLSRGPDGVWKALALRGQAEVLVSVDSTGNVSLD
jgi:hypothetical protein